MAMLCSNTRWGDTIVTCPVHLSTSIQKLLQCIGIVVQCCKETSCATTILLPLHKIGQLWSNWKGCQYFWQNIHVTTNNGCHESGGTIQSLCLLHIRTFFQ